jgi:hypothetical protein
MYPAAHQAGCNKTDGETQSLSRKTGISPNKTTRQ